jgi:hypothetical protein
MKICTLCRTPYEDASQIYCLKDGTKLVNDTPSGFDSQPDTLPFSREVMECPDKWLHKIADDDKRDIQSLVIIISCHYNDFYLKEPFPYLLFTFSVINASVYQISIENSLKGTISLNHQRFSNSPNMEQPSLAKLQHGGKIQFKIRQPLNPHEADFVREANNRWFSFKNLVINFTSDADGEIKPLKLPEEVSKTGELLP